MTETEADSYMGFTPDQEARFWRYNDAIAAHGYAITATPIEGLQELFLKDVSEALQKITDTAAYLSKVHRYRGISRSLKNHLHQALPEPSFNVQVKIP